MLIQHGWIFHSSEGTFQRNKAASFKLGMVSSSKQQVGFPRLTSRLSGTTGSNPGRQPCQVSCLTLIWSPVCCSMTALLQSRTQSGESAARFIPCQWGDTDSSFVRPWNCPLNRGTEEKRDTRHIRVWETDIHEMLNFPPFPQNMKSVERKQSFCSKTEYL